MAGIDQSNQFGAFDPDAYAAEAAGRWPDEYRESQQRTSRYGKEDWKQALREGEEIASKLAALHTAGVPAASAEAMGAAEEHRLSIDRWYYPCSREMHVALGEMYVVDPRFTEYWDNRAPGLAQFVRDAIAANGAR